MTPTSEKDPPKPAKDMLWLVRRLRVRWHGRTRITIVALSVALLILVVTVMRNSAPQEEYDESQRNLWLKQSPEIDELLASLDSGSNSVLLMEETPGLLIDGSVPQLGPFLSPFVIPAEEDFSRKTYLVKRPVGNITMKNVSIYDPAITDPKLLVAIDFSKCEYSKCVMTPNHTFANAIVFMADKLAKVDKLPDIRRRPDQYWVFRTMEAPSRFSYFVFLNKTIFRDVFNWTMTFRMDSDIPTPFGKLVETYITAVKDYDALYASKTKSVAIFTTYCEIRAKSLDFVKKMTERIDVDIFGPCGNKQCSANGPIDWDSTKNKKLEPKDCLPMLSKYYKFYMVFENSICRDYVTETFFQAFGDVDVVPVVRGGTDYKSYFPFGTLIDASDFSSPVALADYLADIGKDKDKYTALLRGKHNYVGIPDFPPWQCKLCQHLHTHNGTKNYANIQQWWAQIPCRDPGTDVPAL